MLSAIDHQGQEGLGEDQEMSFEHIEYEMPIQLSGVYTVGNRTVKCGVLEKG